MDEQFLTLEGGQDFIDYWLYTDKELHLCEDILPLFGFGNPSVTQGPFLFFSSLPSFGNSFRNYERIGPKLLTILVKSGISVKQRIKSFSSKPRPV